MVEQAMNSDADIDIFQSWQGLVEVDEMRGELGSFSFSFYDGSMVMISGRAQIYMIFRAMSTIPDTLRWRIASLSFLVPK